MIDGIAGSGKTTVIQAMHETLVTQGVRCYRMQDWKGDHPPAFDEIPDADVLFTFEPTRTWVGRAIRDELSHIKDYNGVSHAHAFALDREIQYRRLILPALDAGKIIVQDRGVSSSIVYQPIMENSLSLEEVCKLPGNALALENVPTHFIHIDCPIDRIADRIRSRTEESKGVYIDVEYLRHVDARYREPWFRELFESRGTQMHSIDTGGTLEETRERAAAMIRQLVRQ